MPSTDRFDPTNYLSLIPNGDYTWHDGSGTITYSFLSSIPDYYENAWGTGYEIDGVQFGVNADPTLTANQRSFAELAIERFNEIANINLVEVSIPGTVGEVTFGSLDFSDPYLFGFAYYPGGHVLSGDIWLNEAADSVANPSGYGLGWSTFIHELGHALGLDHPFEGTTLPSSLDHPGNTVMSYGEFPGQDSTPYADRLYPIAPTLYDIQAIQALYGSNMNTRTGDDVYFASGGVEGFEITDGQTLIATVWDAGGNDTFSAEGLTQSVSIDLRPGALSTIGSLANNISIALGVDGTTASSAWIENAIGGSGNDTIVGNEKDNVIAGKDGADNLTGGDGFDTVNYWQASSGVHVQLDIMQAIGGDGQQDVVEEFEAIWGSDGFSDILKGSNEDNFIHGGGGNDQISGLNGTDYLVGGLGDDIVDGGAGGDLLEGGEGFDTLDYWSSSAGVFIDLTTGFASGGEATGDVISEFEAVWGADGYDDVVFGSELVNFMNSGAGDDKSYGLGGDDYLVGGLGNDILSGNQGGDFLDGGGGFDTLDYWTSNAGVTINIDIGYADGGDAVGDAITGFEAIWGSNSFGDILVGSSDGNYIDAGGGDDWLDGLAGDDHLVGGLGNDGFLGNSGSDTIIGGDGYDVAHFAGAATDYQVTDLGSGNWQIVHTATGDDDQLAGVEEVSFHADWLYS